MPSKILSFIVHVPGTTPGSYPSVPMATTKSERKQEVKVQSSGHFTAIYENDRFVRFKYIHNPQ
jgi:hypothetical protein